MSSEGLGVADELLLLDMLEDATKDRVRICRRTSM